MTLLKLSRLAPGGLYIGSCVGLRLGLQGGYPWSFLTRSLFGSPSWFSFRFPTGYLLEDPYGNVNKNLAACGRKMIPENLDPFTGERFLFFSCFRFHSLLFISIMNNPIPILMSLSQYCTKLPIYDACL